MSLRAKVSHLLTHHAAALQCHELQHGQLSPAWIHAAMCNTLADTRGCIFTNCSAASTLAEIHKCISHQCHELKCCQTMACLARRATCNRTSLQVAARLQDLPSAWCNPSSPWVAQCTGDQPLSGTSGDIPDSCALRHFLHCSHTLWTLSSTLDPINWQAVVAMQWYVRHVPH